MPTKLPARTKKTQRGPSTNSARAGEQLARYVAFLRGVSPMNARMPELKRCWEAAGFRNVRTVLASGNVVFDAASSSESDIERRLEAAMESSLDRVFYSIVRPVEELKKILASDPYSRAKMTPTTKRVVTFLRQPHARLSLPIEAGKARVVASRGREVFSVYIPDPGNPEFMRLLEKTLGKDITTRTWETVTKCAAA